MTKIAADLAKHQSLAAKHTPGPWHLSPEGYLVSATYDVTQTSKTTRFIAEIFERGTQALADAKLIAAAPDMAEALKAGITVITGGVDETMEPWAEEIVKIFRAALAKAGIK